MNVFRKYSQPILLSSLLLAISFQYAQAARAPNSLITDERVKQVAYDPNQVYEIIGTYGYQTTLEFNPDEAIKVVTLGDSIAWQTVPYQHRLFLKPVEPNAATNLTVITDKRTYYFKLSSSRNRSAPTFLVRFLYPTQPTPVPSDRSRPTSAVAVDPARLNLDYSSAGNKNAIPLKRVFDDGQFTYFLFAPGGDIPAIYTVGPDDTESIVNTRREGDYLVVERTNNRFTLRNGTSTLCVRSNSLAAKVAFTQTPSQAWGH